MGTYTKSSINRAPRPRSERLRESGAAIVSTSTSPMSGAGYIPSGSNHTHANLDALNMITVDDGYIYLTDTYTDETTDEQVTETVKVKAGYADRAAANADGYTLDWFIPVTVNGVLTLKLNPIYAGLWAEGWSSAGGTGTGGGGGGGATFLSELEDVNLGTLASGNLLAWNGTVWTNIDQSTITPDLTGYATQAWVNGRGFITNESDPVFSASAAAGITASDITAWNNKTSNTGTVTSVTLTSGTGITVTNSGTAITTSGSRTISISSAYQVYIEHGQNAYDWGNHANAGYLTAVPKATDSVIGGFQTGYTESGKNYAVRMSGNKAYVNVPWTDTVYTHPTDGAGVKILPTNGKVLSAITVDAMGHVTAVGSKTLAKADIPALDYLPLTGGDLSGDIYHEVEIAEEGSDEILIDERWRITSNGEASFSSLDVNGVSFSLINSRVTTLWNARNDYLLKTGGELTGDLWLHTGSANYGSKLWFGDKGSGDGYVYLYEDTDDHLHIHADKGIKLSTGSSYGIALENNVTLNSARSFTLGSGVLTWDSTNSAWKLTGNFYATGFLTAGGVNIQNGVLNVENNVVIDSSKTVTFGSGAVLSYSSGWKLTSSLNVTALTIGSGSSALNVASAITDLRQRVSALENA